MRLVSQNGDIDVPYELTAVHRCDEYVRMNIFQFPKDENVEVEDE